MTQPIPLYKYVPLNQYTVPNPPAQAIVRKGLAGLAGQLRRSPTTIEPFTAKTELQRVSEPVLENFAPTPWYGEALPTLNNVLGTWLTTHATFPIQMIVGAPYSRLPFLLQQWGDEQHWRIMQPPSSAHILNGGNEWLEQTTHASEMSLVIPALERYYLRHAMGLSLLRRLLDWVLAKRCRCVIGCQSWAYAYLSYALQINTLTAAPLTLQAFDRNRLHQWLQSLANQGQPQPLFRQTNNGKHVLSPLPHSATENTLETTAFLHYLAAYSRGIPEIAWSVWRFSLRMEPEAKENKQPLDINEQERTFWVEPWEQLSLPKAAGVRERNHLFILHTLLLHDGLTPDILCQLLPFSPATAMQSVYQLHALGLLEVAGDNWQISPLAYSPVYELLKREGFVTSVI